MFIPIVWKEKRSLKNVAIMNILISKNKNYLVRDLSNTHFTMSVSWTWYQNSMIPAVFWSWSGCLITDSLITVAISCGQIITIFNFIAIFHKVNGEAGRQGWVFSCCPTPPPQTPTMKYNIAFNRILAPKQPLSSLHALMQWSSLLSQHVHSGMLDTCLWLCGMIPEAAVPELIAL